MVLSRLNHSGTFFIQKMVGPGGWKPMHLDDELIFAVPVKIVPNLRLHIFFKTTSEKSSFCHVFFLL